MEERSKERVHVVDGTPEQATAVFSALFGPADTKPANGES